MGDELDFQREEEWGKLYQRNVTLVYQICYVYLKNTADAEDAVQTVFLKSLKAQTAFQNDDHERAWMVTTAKNCCRDMLRSWWRRKRTDLESLPEPILQEKDELAGTLMEALFALPEKYRIVLYLYYIEGYSTRETAHLLGRKESTIRSQLLRGREKLKQDLGGEYFG